jgi:flagellar hook-basal body complex protein FliE
MNINSIQPIRPPALPELSPKPAVDGASFGAAFGEALAGVNAAQRTAQSGVEQFLNGENVELHQIALDQQRAALSFDLFLQVRNKVVQAYQEVMRMQM